MPPELTLLVSLVDLSPGVPSYVKEGNPVCGHKRSGDYLVAHPGLTLFAFMRFLSHLSDPILPLLFVLEAPY